MPSNNNSTEPTGENSTGENSTEIQFEYKNSLHDESYTNWMFNCDHLYELFAKTDQRDIADMTVLQRMERIKSFNSFLNEQIKKGKMKEIPFEYDDSKSWKLNKDRLFKVFLHIHTNEIYDLHFLNQNKLFNIFLKEQIEKGIMEPRPAKKRPRHMRRSIASLEKNKNSGQWIETLNHKPGVPLTDQELKEFGVHGFAGKLPQQSHTSVSSEKPKKPKQTNNDAPKSVFAWLNHTSTGG